MYIRTQVRILFWYEQNPVYILIQYIWWQIVPYLKLLNTQIYKWIRCMTCYRNIWLGCEFIINPTLYTQKNKQTNKQTSKQTDRQTNKQKMGYKWARNVRFSENLAYFVFLKHPLRVHPLALLSTNNFSDFVRIKYDIICLPKFPILGFLLIFNGT